MYPKSSILGELQILRTGMRISPEIGLIFRLRLPVQQQPFVTGADTKFQPLPKLDLTFISIQRFTMSAIIVLLPIVQVLKFNWARAPEKV